MNWYCEKCKRIHLSEEMCPQIKRQLSQHPEWIAEAANFTTVAGENFLVSSQALDAVVKNINNIAGTNLSYEGTQQFARDIQVFRRLNDEPFSRSGHFASPSGAKSYFENVLKISENKPRALTSFEAKLTGDSQEVDWVRQKHGELASVMQKSELLNNNAPGIDGITINRFTGKEISSTTIKASINPMTSNSTGIKDVQEAIRKGTASEDVIIYGPVGTKEAAREAGLKNPVVEKNTTEQIQSSNKRLERKILDGEAVTSPTIQQVGSKMLQGAVVGAAVALTVSTISSYARYKMGEIDRETAWKNITEDTAGGLLVGAAMGAVTIFLPGGAIGFIAGAAIGLYVSKTCTNLLDEVFGKGSYAAILNSSGYVYGMTMNLAEYYAKIKRHDDHARENLKQAQSLQQSIDRNFDLFEQMKGE